MVLSLGEQQRVAFARCFFMRPAVGKRDGMHFACNRGTRHVLHIARHTSHVTRHTSHVTRHTSHVTLAVLDESTSALDPENEELMCVPDTACSACVTHVTCLLQHLQFKSLAANSTCSSYHLLPTAVAAHATALACTARCCTWASASSPSSTARSSRRTAPTNPQHQPLIFGSVSSFDARAQQVPHAPCDLQRQRRV